MLELRGAAVSRAWRAACAGLVLAGATAGLGVAGLPVAATACGYGAAALWALAWWWRRQQCAARIPVPHPRSCLASARLTTGELAALDGEADMREAVWRTMAPEEAL